MQERIAQAAEAVRKHCGEATVGIVLGSGLGSFADALEDPRTLPFEEIPGFVRSTVAGHAGSLSTGTLSGRRVLVMRGRFHYYEGYSAQEITLPIRVMRALGLQTVILTNAAGAVNTAYTTGDLMLITDFLNLSGVNPLRGPNLENFGPRFPDMSVAMTPALQELARGCAKKLGIPLREGVYAQMQGPSYETPAEIRMVRTMGGDAVGMSTVPEILVAAHSGMQVLGISLLSNMAAGILNQPLTHTEVVEAGVQAQQAFTTLLLEILQEMKDA